MRKLTPRNIFLSLCSLSLMLCAGCATSKRIQTQNVTIQPLGPQSGIVLIGNFPESGRLSNVSFAKSVSGYGFQVWNVSGLTENGVRRLTAEIYNSGHHPRNFQYKVTWYDALGMEIKVGPDGWYPLHIDKRDLRSISLSCPSTRAVSFKLFVRKVR